MQASGSVPCEQQSAAADNALKASLIFACPRSTRGLAEAVGLHEAEQGIAGLFADFRASAAVGGAT